VYRIKKLKKAIKVQQRAVEPLMNKKQGCLHNNNIYKQKRIKVFRETPLPNKRILIPQYRFVFVCGYYCCVDGPINAII
jgi:hypothetical protein